MALSAALLLPGLVLFFASPYVAVVWAVAYALLASSLVAAALLIRRPASHAPSRLAQSTLFRLAIVAALGAVALLGAWLVFLADLAATWPKGIP